MSLLAATKPQKKNTEMRVANAPWFFMTENVWNYLNRNHKYAMEILRVWNSELLKLKKPAKAGFLVSFIQVSAIQQTI